ncbi:lactoylglutathione lyase [Alcaligenes ammonioxydans]|uniref:lactoylglutathione lyase n=1 Tax=Alcaligenes TaxID=507 RepID=UPI001F069DC8|nr:lactoylglutathione lyase [Alcaligenes ammonioxydans]MCH1879306.1 lactoylglutathione lyase [Alcaligenes ammonioxydans]HRK85887.1 lactoylglutathione lyase [Alcaligenes faecalis]
MSTSTIQFGLDHVMLRVLDLDRSLAFYRDVLGMQVVRHTDYESGRFTNVFLSFDPSTQSSLELTWNWDQDEPYEKGGAFGHLALMVRDVHQAVDYLQEQGVRIKTPPKQMSHGKRTIAFVFDPDDYLIELVEPLA